MSYDKLFIGSINTNVLQYKMIHIVLILYYSAFAKRIRHILLF